MKNKAGKEKRVAFKRSLEVVLTAKEKQNAGSELAKALNRQAALEAEMRAFSSQKKAEIAQLAADIEKNTLLINTGKEFRMVECEWMYQWKEGKKTAVRTDTGEILGREDITDGERQLDFAPKEKAAAK